MAYPGGFTLQTDRGVEDGIPLPISSIAVTVGDMLMLTVGATTWVAGTSSTTHWERKAVAMETVTSAATEVKCQEIFPGQMWIVELANNSDAAHNGDRMVLTDTNTVNNTGTDSAAKEAVFIQYSPLGTNTDKRAIGRFVAGNGVNPDAT